MTVPQQTRSSLTPEPLRQQRPPLVGVLQDIARLTIDSEQRLGEAADVVDGDSVRQLLSSAAQRRADHARDLAGILEDRNAPVPERGTLLGMLHRGWIAARATINLGYPQVVLLEARRGEKHMADLYEEALQRAVDPAVTATLKRHRQEIADTRWRIDTLLHSDDLLN